MQLTQRYRYATHFNTLYRFRQAKWKDYLLAVAAGKNPDVGQYGEIISYWVYVISQINPEQAQELINEESKLVDIKEIGLIGKNKNA